MTCPYHGSASGCSRCVTSYDAASLRDVGRVALVVVGWLAVVAGVAALIWRIAR